MSDKNCLRGLTLERYTLGLHVIGVCGILRLAVVSAISCFKDTHLKERLCQSLKQFYNQSIKIEFPSVVFSNKEVCGYTVL